MHSPPLSIIFQIADITELEAIINHLDKFIDELFKCDAAGNPALKHLLKRENLIHNEMSNSSIPKSLIHLARQELPEHVTAEGILKYAELLSDDGRVNFCQELLATKDVLKIKNSNGQATHLQAVLDSLCYLLEHKCNRLPDNLSELMISINQSLRYYVDNQFKSSQLTEALTNIEAHSMTLFRVMLSQQLSSRGNPNTLFVASTSEKNADYTGEILDNFSQLSSLIKEPSSALVQPRA